MLVAETAVIKIGRSNTERFIIYQYQLGMEVVRKIIPEFNVVFIEVPKVPVPDNIN